MDKRHAKQRALALSVFFLKAHIEDGSLMNAIDDDTSDDDAQRIMDEIALICERLEIRSENFRRFRAGLSHVKSANNESL